MTISSGYCSRAQFVSFISGGEGDANPSNATLADAAVNAASRAIDDYTGQFFFSTSAAVARTFTATQPDRIKLPPFSSTSGLIVATDDGNNGSYNQTWTITTDYILKPDSGYDHAGQVHSYNELHAVGGRRFPLGPRPRVQVTAQWGWTAVPPQVYEACLIMAGRIYKRQDSPTGVEGGYDFGVVRISTRTDPDVAMLLSKYRSLVGRIAL